jgi:hypothetical protein
MKRTGPPALEEEFDALFEVTIDAANQFVTAPLETGNAQR